MPEDEVLSAERWLSGSGDFQETINFVLSILHPELHKKGECVLDELRKSSDPVMRKWACCWESVYTATTVVSSRTAPPHFDRKGFKTHYDALASFGAAEAKLVFPQLDAELAYAPGTVIYFSGSLFQHEVPEWGRGERISYASFMRPEILHQFCSPVDWPALP